MPSANHAQRLCTDCESVPARVCLSFAWHRKCSQNDLKLSTKWPLRPKRMKTRDKKDKSAFEVVILRIRKIIINWKSFEFYDPFFSMWTTCVGLCALHKMRCSHVSVVRHRRQWSAGHHRTRCHRQSNDVCCRIFGLGCVRIASGKQLFSLFVSFFFYFLLHLSFRFRIAYFILMRIANYITIHTHKHANARTHTHIHHFCMA